MIRGKQDGERREGLPTSFLIQGLAQPQSLISFFLFAPDFFFPVLFPSHRHTMSVSPIQADILHYMCTITNRCRALNDSVKNELPRETCVMLNDLFIHLVSFQMEADNKH